MLRENGNKLELIYAGGGRNFSGAVTFEVIPSPSCGLLKILVFDHRDDQRLNDDPE